MNHFSIRRRVAADGPTAQELDDMANERAEQRFEEERDRHAEELYKERA